MAGRFRDSASSKWKSDCRHVPHIWAELERDMSMRNRNRGEHWPTAIRPSVICFSSAVDSNAEPGSAAHLRQEANQLTSVWLAREPNEVIELFERHLMHALLFCSRRVGDGCHSCALRFI